MSEVSPLPQQPQGPSFNFCLIDPALLPEWFWVPTGHKLQEQGHNYYIPDLRRGDSSVGVEAKIDIIEDTMKGHDMQYVVALSRGVEFAVRYLARLQKKQELSSVIGFMVISSVGPRGYEKVSGLAEGDQVSRHTVMHNRGLVTNEDGLEVIDRTIAEQHMLHDISDSKFRGIILDNLINEYPLQNDEIESVPQLEKNALPMAWYIGLRDRVDNIALSAAVAKERFGVLPTFRSWGHVGPLSHTHEAANDILEEANAAYSQRRKESTVVINEDSLVDHRDSIVHMTMRRMINGEYAEEPVDFNAEGFKAAEKILGKDVLDNSVVVDIGSSTGQMIAEGALATGTKARIICVEPHPEAVELRRYVNEEYKRRVDYIEGSGENIPLKDNSVRAAFLHNVIFRSDNREQMLSEVQRVVVPGGVVAISSNAKGHAHWRHEFEKRIAEIVSTKTGQIFRIPRPPAEGNYLEDLPALFERVGGFEVCSNTLGDKLYVSQDTEAIITRGTRLDNYLHAIEFAAINTGLKDEYYHDWRAAVNTWLRTYIESEIDKVQEIYEQQGTDKEPFFGDSIRRGMYVLINKKDN